MTEETKRQIEKDSDRLAMRPAFSGGSVSAPADKLLIAKGMLHQYPIGVKEGYNQAVDDALKEVAYYKSDFEYSEDYIELRRNIEKLRK